MGWELGISKMPGGTKEDYDILEEIGSGSFGICQKIRRKTDNMVLAWKIIEYGGMSSSEKQQLVKEVNLLREFKHQHIVRYFDRIIDRSNGRLYIVMEYCSGGDMSCLITRMKKERKLIEEEFIWRVMYQLLLALGECHKRRDDVGGKVLHRDIKPANVFIDCNGDIKLGDFGLARILHDTSLAKTIVGTPYYMSPEQFQCTVYDHKSDMWSLGCLLHELCALSHPFTAHNEKELMTKVCHGYFTRIPSYYSDQLHSTISSLLHVRPEKRPPVSTILHTAQDRVHKTQKQQQQQPQQQQQRHVLMVELQQREKAIIDKERTLYLKEKDLRRREKVIEIKEQQLMSREKQLLKASPTEVDELAKKFARIRIPMRKKENIINPDQ